MRSGAGRDIEGDFRKYFGVKEEISQTSRHSIKWGRKFIARARASKKLYHFTQTGCIEEFNGFLDVQVVPFAKSSALPFFFPPRRFRPGKMTAAFLDWVRPRVIYLPARRDNLHSRNLSPPRVSVLTCPLILRDLSPFLSVIDRVGAGTFSKGPT